MKCAFYSIESIITSIDSHARLKKWCFQIKEVSCHLPVYQLGKRCLHKTLLNFICLLFVYHWSHKWRFIWLSLVLVKSTNHTDNSTHKQKQDYLSLDLMSQSSLLCFKSFQYAFLDYCSYSTRTQVPYLLPITE